MMILRDFSLEDELSTRLLQRIFASALRDVTLARIAHLPFIHAEFAERQ